MVESDLFTKNKIQRHGTKSRITTTRWWLQSSHKTFILVLKLYILYKFNPLICFQSNFGIKVYFCYSLAHGLRDKRKKSSKSDHREIKSMFPLTSATKIVDLWFKGFHLARRFSFKCFLTLKWPKKQNLSLGGFFILGFFRGILIPFMSL
jgi:hypothetical protein